MNPDFDEVVVSWPTEHSFCRWPRRDIDPWIGVAGAILRGDYDSSDASTREALIIGLTYIAHPDADKALAHLNALPKPKAIKID